MMHQVSSIPRPALVLGLGGLLPFLATAVAAWVYADLSGAATNEAIFALGGYGAVILSFLGGVRWGKLLDDDTRLRQWRPLTMSIVPSLVAWAALLLPPSSMLLLLITGFACQLALDYAAARRGELLDWFVTLRVILTGGAVFSLLVALVALTVR